MKKGSFIFSVERKTTQQTDNRQVSDARLQTNQSTPNVGRAGPSRWQWQDICIQHSLFILLLKLFCQTTNNLSNVNNHSHCFGNFQVCKRPINTVELNHVKLVSLIQTASCSMHCETKLCFLWVFLKSIFNRIIIMFLFYLIRVGVLSTNAFL